MKSVSDKTVEKIKTHVSFIITFFLNHAVYETKWKNILQPGRPQMTIWGILIACWMRKATNTYLVYVTIVPLPLQ